ncbi:MAG: aconitate hydratase [Peptostreptococcaceae bacterium]|jgi:aconitate hydratase|nr:aconitate hydratase [Peptostreptococcaceae bacterium]
MKLNLFKKILKNKLYNSSILDDEINIKIDQTLTQDSTGTMTYLQLEKLNLKERKTKLSVAYIDHNLLQSGPENADDHLYIKSICKKYNIYYSKPGTGICHQVHLERFSKPTQTLLGSDSHTPTSGALSMIAIGAGGLDIACAIAGKAYTIKNPKVINVKLNGKLNNNASAKDIILKLLKDLTVKGGVNKVFEYSGSGVKYLSIPQRATICNMGAELGATTSIFPSDDMTYEFLKAQGRDDDFVRLEADEDCIYDDFIEINLDELNPLIACPHSPDNIKEIRDLKNIKIDQICIGSCTNSSFKDLSMVSHILKNKKVHDDVSLTISPGSKQVLSMLAESGDLKILIDAGARILESSCGPCIGMGQSPNTNSISLRTFNRNFKGRCGTTDASVYLTSPKICAITAITGVLDSSLLDELDNYDFSKIKEPNNYLVNDNTIIKPAYDTKKTNEDVKIIKGPNIKDVPLASKMTSTLKGKILTKLDDDITTDHIMPSNSKLLPYRSNIPYLSKFVLKPSDDKFYDLAIKEQGGFILAGENYGQGSSREHAALGPLYLNIKAVLAKSFARIHKKNLINNGIIPLEFKNKDDYLDIDVKNNLVINDLIESLKSKNTIDVINEDKNKSYTLEINLSKSQRELILKGGLLNMLAGDLNA